MTSPYIETTSMNDMKVQEAIDKLNSFPNRHVEMLNVEIKNISVMKIRYTRKYTGKTHNGLYRKTKIVGASGFFFSKLYRSKKGTIICNFVSNNEPIQDRYNGKERNFTHIEIPLDEVASAFYTDCAKSFRLKIALEVVKYLEDNPNATMEKDPNKRSTEEEIESRYKGVPFYGSFS